MLLTRCDLLKGFFDFTTYKRKERYIAMNGIKNVWNKVATFFKNVWNKVVAFCKEKTKNVKWKVVWDKVTTGLLILLMASPIIILTYILVWFITK